MPFVHQTRAALGAGRHASRSSRQSADARPVVRQLQRQHGNAATQRVLVAVQRVHFPYLRAVVGGYRGEANTANNTANNTRFHELVRDRISLCETIYGIVTAHRGTGDLTIRQAQVGATIALSGFGGPYDPGTTSTTLTRTGWQTRLALWRRLFDTGYFRAPRDPTSMLAYPGGVPFNFHVNDNDPHDIWLERSLKEGVVRDDATAQQQSLVTVAGGRLWRSSGAGPPQPVDTGESATWVRGLGWEIYVISHDGRLHMASHLAGRRHHSSLLGHHATPATNAVDAAGAGEVKVEGGRIRALSIKTGHYQSGDQQLRQAVRLLLHAGRADLRGTPLFDGRGSPVLDALGHPIVDADAWWRSRAGRATYDREKTDHVAEWYRTTHTAAAVGAALVAHGWTSPNAVRGRGPWTKGPGGGMATALEVRKALKSLYGAWTPRTTTGADPTRRPSNV